MTNKDNNMSKPCLLARFLTVVMLSACFSFHAWAANEYSLTATGGTLSATYSTLGAAFTAINAGTHTGVIVINITANPATNEGVNPATLNSSGAGSASYTSLLIQPTVDGVTISGSPVTGFGVIQLNGADNVTIDGDNPITGGTNRNLTVSNTTTNTVIANSAIRIATSAAVTSADNITIKNCNLLGNVTGGNSSLITLSTGSSNSSFGIYCGGNGGATATGAPTAITSVTTQTAPSGTTINSLLIDNNSINQCARGIVFNGAATTVSNAVTITNNSVGTSGALGTYPFSTPTTTVYTKAIWIAGTNALTITGNTLNNILSYVATGMTGIELISPIGTGTVNISNNTLTAVTNNGTSNGSVGIQVSSVGGPFNVTGNTISNIQDNTSVSQVGIQISTSGGIATINKNIISGVYARSTGGYGAFGINLATAANACIIQNNIIYDLNAVDNNSASSTLGPVGIRLASGTGHKVYHNSVNLFGAALAGGASAEPSACLMITNTCTGLDVRNNLFQNTRTGSFSGSVNCAISLTSGLTVSANYTINNNAYYVPTGTNFFMASTNSTSNTYTTANFNPAAITPAANWRSYTSTLNAAGTNDNASYGSINAAPFISNTNLLLNTTSSEVINNLWNKGATGTGVTTDIQGEIRPQGVATNPTIGADEVLVSVCISSNGGTVSPSTASVCTNGTYSMTSTGSTTGAGITNQWEVSTVGGGLGFANVSGGSGATTSAYTTAALTTGTYYYRLKVVCSNGPITGYSNELTVTVNPLPTVTVTPTSASYCTPGGSPVTLTAGGALSYAWSPTSGLTPTSGSPVSANPTSTTIYTVTGTNVNGCTGTATSTITVTSSPASVVITPSAPTICSGTTQMLTSTGGPGTSGTSASIGAGVTFTSLTGEQTAFCNRRLNYVGQTIYTAAELSAAGVVAGASITSLAYNISANGDATTNANFTVKIGHVGTTTVFPTTAFFSNTAYTTVYGPATYTHTAPGWQTITFTTPFAWDGSSNICVDVRHDGIDNINNATTQYSTTAGISSLYGYNTPAAGTTSTSRLNIQLGYLIPSTTVVWSPTTNLFTNAGATIAYTGAPSTNVVYFNGTSTTSYTVTSTNAANCTSTGNVTVTVTPLACSAATASTPKCAGTNFTVTANTTGGGAPYNYTWSDGVGGVYPNAATITANKGSGIYTFTCSVTDGCGGSCNSNITVVVNGLPLISVTPPTGTICNPGGTAVSLTASGALTYAWSPATGLSAVTGSSVSANPTANTTYTVSGTDANGCVGSTTVPVSISITPTVSASATPSSICSGKNSQLNVNASVPASVTNYSFTASSGTYSPIAGGTVLASSSWDDSGAGISIPLGFSFNFNGTSYTSCNINLNGYVSFGTTTSTNNYQPINTLTSNEVGIIAGFARDLQGITTTGEVRYLSSGGVFTVQWSNARRYFSTTTNAESFNFQIQLYQTTNQIKLVYGSFSNAISASSSVLPQVGLRGATTAEFKNVEVLSTGSWTTPAVGTTNAASAYYNETTATVKPSSGQTYTFSPPAPAFTYAWSPASFLTATNISNPIAQTVTGTTIYTVTVTANGCSQTATTTVSVNPSPIATATGDEFCAGTTISLFGSNVASGQTSGNTYVWSGPNGFSSALQNPTISNANAALHNGNYSVTVTNSTLCTATANTTVNVNPNPTVSISGLINESCPGAANGSFVATATGGESPYDYTLDFIDFNQDGIFTALSPATYTVNVQDGNGCAGTATAVITSPNSAPAITCGGPLSVNTDAGLCSATLTNGQLLAQIGSVTGTPAPVVTFMPAAGSFPVGTTLVTATATNSCGSSTCSFNVVVTDAQNPVITCPPNITTCNPVVTFNVTATDNCSVANVVNTPASGSTFAVGTTTVVSVANDVNGNTSTCSFTVTVNPPVNAGTVSGNSPICAGYMEPYTSTGTIGGSWSSDNSTVATVDVNGIVTAVSAGTAHIIYTINAGCGAPVSSQQSVTVTAAPVCQNGGTVNSMCGCNCPSGFSGVFCENANSFTITASAGPNGTISPNGAVVVANGGNQSFTITADPCYSIANVIVDGSSLGALTTYTFSNVNGNHTISASFSVNLLSSDPSSASSDALNDNICIGNSVNLTVNGGALVSGASWKWYAGSCGGTFVGTGSTIAVSPSATTTYFVRGESSCGNTNCVNVTVKVSTAPVSSNAIVPFAGLTDNVCNGSTVTISVPAIATATFYTWDAPTGSYFNGNVLNVSPFTTSIPSVTIAFGNPSGSLYNIGVQAGNACGSSLRQGQKIRGLTSTPAGITGVLTACANTSQIYSTPAVTGASSYLWTISGDAAVTGTSTSATVTFGPSWTGGTLCVAAQTSCYTSPSKCLAISNAAAALGIISGSFTACPNSVLNFSVPASAGAASYNWTVPSNAIVTSGQGTNSISVSFLSGYSSVGNICVNQTSICGVTSSYKCKTVAPGLPSQPSTINGPTNGLCGQTAVYTCPSQGAGVTYSWTVPSGATLNSGQGSSSISITYGTFTTGNICVSATNACGVSTSRCISVKGAPNAPAAITAIPSSWCANESGIEFTATLSNVTGAYTLNWSYPTSPVATYVLGGGNSSSLIMDWGVGNGNINVTATNACGSGTRTSSWSNTCREGSVEMQAILTVAPNPTTGLLNVSYSAEKGSTVFNVMDLSGRVVMTEKVTSVMGYNTTQLDMSRLAKGAYLLSVQSTQSNRKVRVVVE